MPDWIVSVIAILAAVWIATMIVAAVRRGDRRTAERLEVLLLSVEVLQAEVSRSLADADEEARLDRQRLALVADTLADLLEAEIVGSMHANRRDALPSQVDTLRHVASVSRVTGSMLSPGGPVGSGTAVVGDGPDRFTVRSSPPPPPADDFIRSIIERPADRMPTTDEHAQSLFASFARPGDDEEETARKRRLARSIARDFERMKARGWDPPPPAEEWAE